MRAKSYYKFMLVVDVRAKSQEKAIELLQKKMTKKLEVTKMDYVGKVVK